MADEPERTHPNDQTHRPLPYVIVLRGRITDDGPIERFERHELAYSVYEAMWQALIGVNGAAVDIDKMKFTLESIGPDLPAYLDMALRMLKVVKKETK